MDEFNTARARAALKQRVIVNICRVPAEAAVDLLFIVVDVLTGWLLFGLLGVQRVRVRLGG